MGLTKLAVAITVAPVWAHCGTKNAFTVTLTVTGDTDGAGANYLPSVWDDDGWPNPDDLLVRGNRVAVVGKFRRVHTFTLDCASDCEVVGKGGGSGEAQAEVYGYVEEVNRLFGKLAAESQRVPVWCHTESECPVASVEDSWTEGRLRLDGLAAVRDDLESFAVVNQSRPPEVYQMHPGLALGLRAFRVGEDGLEFGAPVRVVAKLTGNEIRILEEMDGSPICFDPERQTWMPLEDYEYDEGVLRFDTEVGGLFGVAPGERFPRLQRGCATYFLFDRGMEDEGKQGRKKG